MTLSIVEHAPRAGLRDTLGLTIEEFHPLAQGASLSLSVGSHGRIWSERVRAATATTHATFADGPHAGHPAITHNALGAGVAWYVATAPEDLCGVLCSVLDTAGVVRPSDVPDALEVVRHGDTVVAYRLDGGQSVTVAAGDTVILRR